MSEREQFPNCCSALILHDFYDPYDRDGDDDEGEGVDSVVKQIKEHVALAKRQGNWTVAIAVLVRRQVSAIAAFRAESWYESNGFMRKTEYSKGGYGEDRVEDDGMDSRDTILFFLPLGDEVS